MPFQELSSCSILNQGPSFTKTHAVQKYEHDLRETSLKWLTVAMPLLERLEID